DRLLSGTTDVACDEHPGRRSGGASTRGRRSGEIGRRGRRREQSSFEYLGEGNEVPFGERDHDSDRRGGRGSRRFFWKEYDRSFHFWPRSRLGSSFGPLSRNASGTFLPSRRTRTFQKG